MKKFNSRSNRISLRAFFRRFDQLRRSTSFGLGRLFYSFLGRDSNLTETLIPKSEISSILVIRNNKRIGNMYFMIPFMRELRGAYPQAIIDLMIIKPEQKSIFCHIGIDHIVASNFTFGTIGVFFSTIRRYRKMVYDLLIMPNGSETDTIIGGLLRAKNKVTFYESTSCLVYPHSLKVTAESSHAALGCLKLIESLGNTLNPSIDHTMSFTTAEIERGESVARELKGDAHYCFAYFRGARGNKVIPDYDWIRFQCLFNKATKKSIKWVEILSPDVRQPLLPETLHFKSSDLRHLAAVLRALDLFICGDTGPLHLANAAKARCVGIFTTTNPTQFGCLGSNAVNVIGLESLNAEKILITFGL